MKRNKIKKLFLVLLTCLLMLSLCSCGQDMTKNGDKLKVKVKGLGTKTISVIIKGELPQNVNFYINIPEYTDTEYLSDGIIKTYSKPFLKSLKTSFKNKKAECRIQALVQGSCNAELYFSADSYYKDMSVKLGLEIDENMNISCDNITIYEHAQLSSVNTDDSSVAILERNYSNSTAVLRLLTDNVFPFIEGFDEEIIEAKFNGTYIMDGLNCCEYSLKAAKAGECSLTLIDETAGIRYLVGINVSDDSINADVEQNLILSINGITSEKVEGEQIDEKDYNE